LSKSKETEWKYWEIMFTPTNAEKYGILLIAIAYYVFQKYTKKRVFISSRVAHPLLLLLGL
jgi:hypothetical protein